MEVDLSDPDMPAIVPFASTATAKAMQDALKLTRHLPISVNSPLSRLLAARGALDWQTSTPRPDTAPVGWRVLEKQVDSKPKKPSSGFLSFFNRPQETVPDTVPPPPSAVSRFLHRFSRVRSSQHSALALSSDDLEFLSDIVPSATDPSDEDHPTPRPFSPLIPGATRVGNTPTSIVPVLAPPPSPSNPTIVSGQPTQRLTISLSVPPLLPPPPVSPPQTPRPGPFFSASSLPDPYDSDDEFSAFASSPACPSQRPPSPSPPSPPPRRTYERTHYPNSSSASSILSPTSQSSVDKLFSQRSLDNFDDLVSPPLVTQRGNKKRTPSPPPLPAKLSQPPRIDTFPSRFHNTHAHAQSQSLTSPTANTSLMTSVFSSPSVSDAQHQRTQALVNHAAAHDGSTWPNSPNSDSPRLRTILPPPGSPSSIAFEGFDLLGDIGVPIPLGSHPPVGLSDGLGSTNQLLPIRSFSSQTVPFSTTDAGSPQSRQMGGLSAQDLSFFEGA